MRDLPAVIERRELMASEPSSPPEIHDAEWAVVRRPAARRLRPGGRMWPKALAALGICGGPVLAWFALTRAIS